MSSSQPPQIECRWCGARFPEGTQKCPQCERPVLAQTTRSTGAPGPAAPRLRAPRKPRRPLLVAAIVVLAAAGAFTLARPHQSAEFSADVVSSTSGSYAGTPVQSTTTGTYYAKGHHLSRSESLEGSRRWITIHHGDKLWHLDPAAKTYYRMFDFTPEQKAKFDSASRRLEEMSKTKEFRERGLVGREMVNGYLCEKRVGEFAGASTTMWIAPKLNRLMLKQETAMRGQISGAEFSLTSRQEYRNIRERRLPSSLFEVPKDYKEVPPPAPRYGQREQPAEQ